MVFSGIRDGIKKDFKELKQKVQNIDMGEVKDKVQKDFSNLKAKVTKMVISLKRGENVSLTKEAPDMKNMVIGLGWDANSFHGQDFDLDASVILLTQSGKVRNNQDLIYYRHLRSESGAIIHRGDNKTGDGVGDDEQISVELAKLESDIVKLVIPVSIYHAKERKQNFGMVKHAYIRLLNADTQAEVVKYDLTEDYSTETALVLAEIYRHNNEWKIKAIGQGSVGGLEAIGKNYGLSVSYEK